MRRRLNLAFVPVMAVLLCLVLTGCGTSGRDVHPTFPPGTTVFTDRQLEQVVYGDYVVPPGFYSEGPKRVHSMYLYDASIDSTKRHQRWWTPLSTDDPAQARAWADQSVRLWGWGPELTPVGTDTTKIRIISGRVDGRFFEFVARVNVAALAGPSSADLATAPPSFTRLRVHRASYFDCSHVDRSRRAARGSYRVRPMTTEGVRDLAEYLWSQDNSADNSPRALSSVGHETPDSLFHDIYEAKLEYGENGQCHEITLSRWIYSVSRKTGDVLLKREPLRTIPGRVHDCRPD